MKLEENNIIVKRSYKTVYKCDDSIVKVFNEEPVRDARDHPPRAPRRIRRRGALKWAQRKCEQRIFILL